MFARVKVMKTQPEYYVRAALGGPVWPGAAGRHRFPGHGGHSSSDGVGGSWCERP